MAIEHEWQDFILRHQPGHFADIYWCEAKNGPTVVMSAATPTLCQLCNQRLVDDPNPHRFVVHIEKKRL